MSAPGAAGLADIAAAAQRRAADPERSVWVGASAGSGKTKVLTDRVLRLMLSGVPPERLLCLTYTRAAAAEMANRLRVRLAGWAVMDATLLARNLEALTGQPAREATLTDARRLFARVVDAPGRLRIQTIHAFCQAVLRRFPLEAGVAPTFELADEATLDELTREAIRDSLADAAPDLAGRASDGDTARALAVLLSRVDDEGFRNVIGALLERRASFQERLAARDGVAGLVAALHAQLGTVPGQTPAALDGDLVAALDADATSLAAAAALLDGSGSPRDGEAAKCITSYLALPARDRAAGLEAFALCVLTKAGTPRTRLATAKAAAAIPTLSRILERVTAWRTARAAADLAETSGALITLAADVLARLERLKAEDGQLDYDDLIRTTGALLERDGGVSWVLYKLDGGLDHLLLDEAQDTSPAQWRLVEHLTADALADGRPSGEQERHRTRFAVGDPKQSIFSFQGANPRAFDDARRMFPQAEGAIELTVSFRSTQTILDLVDRVCANDSMRGVWRGECPPSPHRAHRVGVPGRIELWPLFRPPPSQNPEDEAWTPPVEVEPDFDSETALAEAVAARVRAWIDTGERVADGAAGWRALHAGDVLVLVRRRRAFVNRLIAAAKRLGISVAGVDRIRLADAPAAGDLVALARTLLQPLDDLSLAEVLVGPMVGFSQETLFALAHGRGERPLFQVLAARAASDPEAERVRDWLERALDLAERLRPHDLLASLLAAPCPSDPDGTARRALWRRLGPDALDALDEVLTEALAYEAATDPSLEGFLAWLANGETEVKREAEAERTQVLRVMTVHGAKGLEAPVVILADTSGLPKLQETVLFPIAPGAAPLWTPRGGGACAAYEAVKAELNAAALDEYQRLLYVALTRARDRLVVTGCWAGAATGEGCGTGSWYGRVREALTGMDGVATVPAAACGLPEWLDPVRVLDAGVPPAMADAPDARAAPPPAVVPPATAVATPTGQRRRGTPEPPPLISRIAPTAREIPDWARRPAPTERHHERPIAPSRAQEDETAQPLASPLSGTDPERAYRRGRLIHRLLQSLPALARAARPAAIARFLARDGTLPDAARARVAEEVLAVLDDPAFGPVFGPGSLAEVAIVGRVAADGSGRPIDGRIDRLVVTKSEVLVVDFKTNRPPPRRVADVPQPYLAQMKLYAEGLRRVWPDRTVRAALLWTDVPDLMEVPAD